MHTNCRFVVSLVSSRSLHPINSFIHSLLASTITDLHDRVLMNVCATKCPDAHWNRAILLMITVGTLTVSVLTHMHTHWTRIDGTFCSSYTGLCACVRVRSCLRALSRIPPPHTHTHCHALCTTPFAQVRVDGNCPEAIAELNLLLKHLHGTADGDAPVMECFRSKYVSTHIYVYRNS